MSLPNADIASAFIESYITIRKPEWHFDVNDHDSVKIPDDATVKHKLAICAAMLVKFKAAKSFDDWIKILDDVYEKESAEIETQQNRFFFTRMVTNQPLISDVLHAVRTYMIAELKSEDQFKRLKDDLTYRKKELEKQILWDKEHGVIQATIDSNQKQLDAINKTLETRNDADEFYIQFFKDKITKLDTQAKKLDEKTFEHFKANVLNKNRPLVICDRLLTDQAKRAIEPPAQTSVPDAAQPSLKDGAATSDMVIDKPVAPVTSTSPNLFVIAESSQPTANLPPTTTEPSASTDAAREAAPSALVANSTFGGRPQRNRRVTTRRTDTEVANNDDERDQSYSARKRR